MASSDVRSFRHITPAEIAWRTEVGVGDPGHLDMFWIDGSLDNGWHIGVGLYRCRPHDGGRPAVTVNVLRPGETFFEQHVTLDDVDFVPSDFGGRWGSAAELVGELDERGNPIGYRLTVDVGRVSMDLMGVVVAAGMKFTTATPGYSHVRPDTGAAVGWWPVAPRSDVRGWISADGARADVTGRTHMERQLSSFRLAGSPGAPSAQSIWTWGHLTCDDYTGIWTDSAASEHMGYRHFTPFVLYRGSDPVLSTFAFSSSVERYVIEPSSGLPRPAVFTLKAAEGERELFARITGGRIHDQFELDGNAGAYYCRQICDVEVELRHWGRTTRLSGEAVYEWGTQSGNFPFAT